MPDGIESRRYTESETLGAVKVANHHLAAEYLAWVKDELRSVTGLNPNQIQTRLARFEELMQRELQKPLGEQNVEAVITAIWQRIDTTADRLKSIMGERGAEHDYPHAAHTTAEPAYS